MDIERIIMCVMAFGAVLGGLDRIGGNRFGFGDKFEKGFQMLGNVGLSMAGIICLAPALGELVGLLVGPMCEALGMDPAVFGSLLAIDMGGYSLAVGLAKDPELGLYAGVIVASMFGATLVFHIPVGVGFLGEKDESFMKGILLGLAVMPGSLLVGGLAMGLELKRILWNSLPVFLLSAALAVGILKIPGAMMKGFKVFARIIRAVATIGLTAAAVTHMTGFVILDTMPPLQEAMKVAVSIGIVMLGGMPLAELLRRLLKRPFRWIGVRTGIDSAGTTAVLVALVSATPALAMLPQMNRRSRSVVAAFLVNGVCIIGSHFAFCQSAAPELVGPLLAAKLAGGILAVTVALICTRGDREQDREEHPAAGGGAPAVRS
ncbi:MAG: ethanolamine utilization protein EutH [Clostridia bacterium]|nr:ethanolamine utilization protein EutH [Clostridia bacterium]